MRLNEAKAGDVVVVSGVDTSERSTLKLMTFGMVEGTTVRCISKLHTAMEVEIHGSRFAISNHLAEAFICKPAGATQGVQEPLKLRLRVRLPPPAPLNLDVIPSAVVINNCMVNWKLVCRTLVALFTVLVLSAIIYYYVHVHTPIMTFCHGASG